MMVQFSALLLLPLLTGVMAVSSKKGVCVPPGTNFHCGDLSPFTNVRLQLTTQRNKHFCLYLCLDCVRKVFYWYLFTIICFFVYCELRFKMYFNIVTFISVSQ